MYLYHGTSSDTIDQICAQNLYFRMSEKMQLYMEKEAILQ